MHVRRRALLATALLASLVGAGPASAGVRLVPIDPRMGTAFALNESGWVAGQIAAERSPVYPAGASMVALWRNGPFVRLDEPTGEMLVGPAWFSADGAHLVASALPAPASACPGGAPHPVLYALGRTDAVAATLDGFPGSCGAWPTGFAGDQPIGVARRVETIAGLEAIGVPPGEFTTLRPMIRAVRWSLTGGAPTLDGEPPAPTITGTQFRDARAVTFHTRLLAGSTDGDVLAQRSAMTWWPWENDWDPTIPLPVAELREGGAVTTFPINGIPSDVFGSPATVPTRVLVLGDDGQVIAGPRSFWTRAGGLVQLPLTGGVAGMSPDGRVAGNDAVTVPGAVGTVLEARVWRSGRVTDVAALARGADPAHASLIYSADGPINRKGSLVLAGCPVAAFQAGGFGRLDPRCQRFRLDLATVVTGQAVIPPPPVLAPQRAPRPAAGVAIVATGSGSTVRATTGSDGRFRLELPEGTWRIALAGRGGCLALAGGACRAAVSVEADGTSDRTLGVRVDPAGPAVALAARRADVRGGAASLRLTCRHVVGCRGRLVLAAARGAGRYGAKAVVLRFGTQTVRVPLGAPARASLAAAGTLAARATLTPAGGAPVRLGALTLAG